MQSYINTKKKFYVTGKYAKCGGNKKGNTSSLQESVINRTKHVPHTPRSSRSRNSVQGVPA